MTSAIWTLTCVVVAFVLPQMAIAQDQAVPGAPAQGDTCEVAYKAVPQGGILDLLDPKAPSERRQAALSAYQTLAAKRECPEFGYTLGQLYRHGEYLPGHLVPQDIEKARALILPMAESGYLPAFADMAEMEMRHANPREAMKWTQVYLHFVDKVTMPALDNGYDTFMQRSAYNGNLLARSELIWHYARPSLSRKLVRQDLDAYLAANGAQVEQRMRARRARTSAQDGGPTHVTSSGEQCYVSAVDRIGAGAAAWIIEVLPSGETGRIVMENFVPKPSVADELATCLVNYRFAAFQGSTPATIRITMTMGSSDGATIKRKRSK